MTTEQFIQKAIEGGWKDPNDTRHQQDVPTVFLRASIFIDPFAWQAVGKVEGWGIEPSGSIWQGKDKWFIRMHSMIDALAEGKTLNEFIATL